MKEIIDKIYWDLNSHIATDKLIFNKVNANASILAITLMRERLIATLPNTTKEDNCTWKIIDEDSGVWRTSCKRNYVLINGTPKDNGMEFCTYCGKSLKVDES